MYKLQSYQFFYVYKCLAPNWQYRICWLSCDKFCEIPFSVSQAAHWVANESGFKFGWLIEDNFRFRNCGGQVIAQHACCLSCLSCCTRSLCLLYIHIRGRLLEQPLYIGIAQNKREPTSSNILLERMVLQHSRGKQPFESNQEKQLIRTQRKFVLNSFWTSINSQHRKS